MEFMEERGGPTPQHIMQALPTSKVTLAQIGIHIIFFIIVYLLLRTIKNWYTNYYKYLHSTYIYMLFCFYILRIIYFPFQNRGEL